MKLRPKMMTASLLTATACLTLLGACNRNTEPTPTSTTETAPASNPTTTTETTPATTTSTTSPDTKNAMTGPSGSASVSAADQSFFTTAAQSGYAEIEASRLAQDHAKDAKVKDFAKTMIDDHTKADSELKQLAALKGVTLPSSDAGKYTADIEGLRGLNGTPFDRTYVEKVAVAAHKDAVSLFEKTAQDGQDADVKAFAAKTLPTLQHHLEMGQALPH